VFIATARTLQVPARFVTGYLCNSDDEPDPAALDGTGGPVTGRVVGGPPSCEDNGSRSGPGGNEAADTEEASLPDGPDADGTAPDAVARGVGRAWVEAHVPGLGWVGFDPANRICVTDRYVRVAIGLDCLGAAPVRGAHFGGGREAVAVRLIVSQAAWQAQG
jgi:transglutaminase-like putative cysteine protease